MRRAIITVSFLLSCYISYSMTESEFDDWKYQTITHINNCESDITTAKGRLDTFRRSYRGVINDMTADLQYYDGTTPEFTGTYIAGLIENYLQALPNEQNLANIDSNIYDAQGMISTAYGLVLGMTYEGSTDLSAISNLLFRIDNKIAAIKFGVETQTNQLNTIINALNDLIIPATSGPNPTHASLRTTLDLGLNFPLSQYLNNYDLNLSSIWTNTTTLITTLEDRLYSTEDAQFFDVQHNFHDWYSEKRGTGFLPNGNPIPHWRPWFDPNLFFDGGFYLDEFLDPILQQLNLPIGADGSFQLSNEGKILLRLFAQGERGFLGNLNIQEMLYSLASATNNQQTVDLSAITNYLYNTQKPFYDNFNTMLKKINPFMSDPMLYYSNREVDGKKPWVVISNLFTLASSDYSSQAVPSAKFSTAYQNFANVYTNIFQRYEVYLMNLCGLFPVEGPVLPENSFEEGGHFESDLGQATNDYGQASTSFSSSSNKLSEVRLSFQRVIDAFDLREVTSSVGDEVYFSVSQQWYGDFEFPDITVHLSETGLGDVCRYAHKFFKVIWYLVFTAGFAVLFFKFAVLGSKTIMRALLLVSTLLGK